MHKRKFLLAAFFLAVISFGMRLNADDQSKAIANYATVKLYFLNQFLPEPQLEGEPQVPTIGGMGGMGGMGSMQMRFETASIFLNDKFVGHTIFRHVDVVPKFNLPPGDYKFRIECAGYKTIEHKLTVLDNGSQQWLAIKLERNESSSPAPSSPVPSSAPPKK